MATTEVRQDDLRLVVASDRSTAELWLPADFPRQMLTPALCEALLREQGVVLTADVLKLVQEAVANPPPLGQKARLALARALPPVHGTDGRLEWVVDAELRERNQEVSHYERSSFVMVKPGQVLARIIDPVPGHDGVDVTGRARPARPGRPVNLRLDETVATNRYGQLVAQTAGALVRQGDKVTIRQLIEVPEYVDFSTGNIDFPGDVLVHKGVRDLFVIKALGNVEVGGLIEGATLDCGGDLIARGGMAGRERGSVTVGGSMTARYLDNVQGLVKGDLRLDREAINCDLEVHGSVQAPGGLIIGGRVLAVGRVEVATLGSPAGVATELILGSVPDLEPPARSLTVLLDELSAHRDDLVAEQKAINTNSRFLTAQDKERQTEISFRLQTVNQRLVKGQTVLDALQQRISERRTVDLAVGRCLHNGATIAVGRQAFRVTADVKGPLRILRDENRNVVYRTPGGLGGPMAQIAEVKARAA